MYWVPTLTGRTFRLDRPDARDVSIDDIAHQLSQICRFNGGTREFYSVAQHSVIVCDVLDDVQGRVICKTGSELQALRLAGLLHDAHEIYIGDVVSPMKRCLGDCFATLEQRCEQAVVNAFDLLVTSDMSMVIKQVDRIVLATEVRDLIPTRRIPEVDLPEPLSRVIVPMPPRVAREKFLGLFEELMGIVG